MFKISADKNTKTRLIYLPKLWQVGESEKYGPFVVVERRQSTEPVGKLAVGYEAVHGSGRLEQFDLRQHLELAPSLVEVDESAVGRVAERRVDHHQVGEKRPEVRHRPLHDRRRATLQSPASHNAPSVYSFTSIHVQVKTRSTQRAQTSAEHGMTQIRLQFFE